MSPADRDKAKSPLDPAPSADRADGTERPAERLGVDADPKPTYPGASASPPGPPAEEYTSEPLPVEQDAGNDSG